MLFTVTLFLTGCSKADDHQLENAEIVQLTNTGAIQNRGSYTLKEGNLEIMKEIQLAQNLDQVRSNLKLSSSEEQEIKSLLTPDFTTEEQELKTAELFQTFVKEIKHVTVEVNQKKTTTLVGKDYRKEFSGVGEVGIVYLTHIRLNIVLCQEMRNS
ncbi:hypothetical protein QJ527_08090 [Enterococcus mundtii]|uniref:hypothetical protein n=1 Tax=Enterococcus TaxID=1350 RepID=UPI00044967D0|nr:MULTISPECIES: hypothetical protein [Enterococcus]EYT96086.1 hypothetical protein AK89_05215 [Enterococcus mundtii CRL35]MDA9428726.1 hypothetical protein [Enterococcus mundtii 1A]MDK4211504.1 hypothetical protein [Enterococcus mundtii]MDO7878780.1 hypothetical protein [Enterococcus mundtii]MEC3941694.1 hypothetical protein [Enterococcus mundtii]